MPPYGLLMGSAMRAARKQADPQMAFIVPAKHACALVAAGLHGG